MIPSARTALLTLLLAACFSARAQDAAPAAPAAPADTAVPPLPRKQIATVYRNGDLDSVLFYLKDGRNRPIFLDKADSTLAFKYLGIIYAAESGSREKGRYYFNQLLRMDPRASITELLPGERARAVYREAREEFFELHPHLAPKPEPAAAAPAPAPAPPPPAVAPKPRGKKWLWIAGGVLAAGGAAATVALLDPPAKVHRLHD